MFGGVLKVTCYLPVTFTGLSFCLSISFAGTFPILSQYCPTTFPLDSQKWHDTSPVLSKYFTSTYAYFCLILNTFSNFLHTFCILLYTFAFCCMLLYVFLLNVISVRNFASCDMHLHMPLEGHQHKLNTTYPQASCLALIYLRRSCYISQFILGTSEKIMPIKKCSRQRVNNGRRGNT